MTASWHKRLDALHPPLGSWVRASVTPCGYCGERNWIWGGFSRVFPIFPSYKFHPAISSLSSHSFHFLRPRDASGVVGRHSQTFNKDASSHFIPRSDFESDTSIYIYIYIYIYIHTYTYGGREISAIILTFDFLCYKEPKSPYNFFLILIFNKLFKIKTSDEWQHWKTGSPTLRVEVQLAKSIAGNCKPDVTRNDSWPSICCPQPRAAERHSLVYVYVGYM